MVIRRANSVEQNGFPVKLPSGAKGLAGGSAAPATRTSVSDIGPRGRLILTIRRVANGQ
jgi:hypothetical protein